MKRIALFSVLAAGIMMLVGCTCGRTPTGFSTNFGGAIYADTTYPSVMQEPINPTTRKYEVIGNVHGTSQSKQYCFLVLVGDNGINAAYQNALSTVKGADDIIDVKVDTHIEGFLSVVYTVCTTHVYGKAIRYLDKK